MVGKIFSTSSFPPHKKKNPNPFKNKIKTEVFFKLNTLDLSLVVIETFLKIRINTFNCYAKKLISTYHIRKFNYPIFYVLKIYVNVFLVIFLALLIIWLWILIDFAALVDRLLTFSYINDS